MASKGITNLTFSDSNVQLANTAPQPSAFYSSMLRLIFLMFYYMLLNQIQFLKYDTYLFIVTHIYCDSSACFSDT